MAGSVERRVGLFVVGALVLLGLLAILAENFRLFPNTYRLYGVFPSVEGLLKNDPVTLGGVKVGQVSSMHVVDEKVMLVLEIDKDIEIREDSVASIRMTSLFGGKSVALTIGDVNRPIFNHEDVVDTVEGIGVDLIMEQVTEALAEAREFIESLNENQDKVLTKIFAMLDENEEDLRETIVAFREAAEMVRDVGPKLDEFMGSATAIAKRIEAGEGTIGKLLASSDLYNDARELADTLSSAAEAADRILRDNESDVREAVSSMRDAGATLNETLDRVASIAKKIDDGEGTIGKAINDPALYDDARQALDRVNEAAEGVREQIPMMAFLSVLFSAFGG